jgi:hypothetical protein
VENSNRPDGSNATAIGWALVVVGVLALFFFPSAETVAGMVFAVALGNLGIGLGVLLLSLGYLVRAIWFLPGRDIPVERTSARAVSTTDCSYCGRDMTPYRACSSVDDETNRSRAPRMNDETCLAAFRSKGLVPEDAGR